MAQGKLVRVENISAFESMLDYIEDDALCGDSQLNATLSVELYLQPASGVNQAAYGSTGAELRSGEAQKSQETTADGALFACDYK